MAELFPILHSSQKWARFHPNRLLGSLQDLAGATPPSGLVLLSILAVQVGAAGAKILLTKLDSNLGNIGSNGCTFTNPPDRCPLKSSGGAFGDDIGSVLGRLYPFSS